MDTEDVPYYLPEGRTMDVERTMQFILDQQARFASDTQIIKEVIKAQQEQFGSGINKLNTILPA